MSKDPLKTANYFWEVVVNCETTKPDWWCGVCSLHLFPLLGYSCVCPCVCMCGNRVLSHASWGMRCRYHITFLESADSDVQHTPHPPRFWGRDCGPAVKCSENFTTGMNTAGMSLLFWHFIEKMTFKSWGKDFPQSSWGHREHGMAVEEWPLREREWQDLGQRFSKVLASGPLYTLKK